MVVDILLVLVISLEVMVLLVGVECVIVLFDVCMGEVYFGSY